MDNNYNNEFDQGAPVQPLFSNNFNNTIPTNPVKTVVQTTQQNYQAPNFNQAPMFNQVQQPQNIQSSVMDTPPVTAPIKNLNDAPVVSGPTLDVLGPMNVMPETIAPADPLTNYENGIGVVPASIPQLESQPVNSNYQTSNYEQPPIFNSQQMSVNNIYQPQPASTNSEFNNFANNNYGQNIVSPPINSGYNQPVSLAGVVPYQAPLQDFNNENHPSLEDPIFNNNVPLNNSEVEISNTPIEESFENISEVSNSAVKEDELNPEINNSISITEEITKPEGPYEMVDEMLNKDNIDSINELGIDESLKTNESDMLDLEEEPASKIEPLKQPEIASPAVDEIKDLVEKLKAKGYNISIEEFDFEQMFQLIIKIDK